MGSDHVPAPSPAPGLRQYSTDDFPARDRFAIWREVVGPAFLRLEVSDVAGHPFRAIGTLCTLPGLGVQWADNSGIRMDRSRGLLSDGADDLILPLVTEGRHFASQRGRQVTLDTQETALLSTADVGSVTCGARSRAIVLRLPRAALAQRVPGLDDVIGRGLPRALEALRLLSRYVRLLRDENALLCPALGGLAAAHVTDLIALALGPTPDAGQLAQKRGVRAARLRAMQADIRANLSNPKLSVATIARRQGVTPRYVHVLFEALGTTFSRFVLRERLDLARRMLADVRQDHLSIAAIAYGCGFGDLSYFNHAFRIRYGATPGEIRRATG
jgi:AraC-like DNA-binding protein